MRVTYRSNLKLIVDIGRVFRPFTAMAQPGSCHLRRHGCIILGDPPTLVPSEGIASEVRIGRVKRRLELLYTLRIRL